jgi:hypothetical protein
MPILGSNSSSGSRPSAPVIGSATDGGTGTTASVAFTPSTYIGKGTITYTATSSPGSITATSSSSPITVTGLTTGTAYTFTVQGTTNYGVASAASSASNSVTPANPSSYESIATFTNTNASSVTFSSIPSTYKSLQVRFSFLTDNGQNINLRLNGDTAANYASHWIKGLSTSVVAAQGSTTLSFMRLEGNSNGTSATYPFVGIIDLIDYASTSKNKTVRSITGNDRNADGGSEINLLSGLWRSTSAVNSLTIYLGSDINFNSGTNIALYGVK